MMFARALVGASLMAIAASAQAQTQPATSQAQPVANADNSVGDIVVTAQRRSESIQRVPVSLTAVSADVLRQKQVNELSQLNILAPSLQVGGDNTFTVRGVGTLAFSGTIDSSVAVSVDDVNYSRPLLNTAKFMDLDRVEVLNGPQGLLFGKNASSGLLNIVTTKPLLHKLSEGTDIEYSSRDRPGTNSNAPGLIVRQTLNIPIGEIAALRVAGLIGYEEPPTTLVGRMPAGVRYDINRGTRQIKAKLLIKPDDSWSVYIIGDYNKLSGSGGYFNTSYRQLAPNSTNVAPLAADGITASPDNFLYAGDGGYYRDIETGGAQASVGYTFGSGLELSNLAAWRFYNQNQQLDVDLTSSDGANINHSIGNYNQYSDELRLALPSGNRLTGQIGLYAFKSTLNYDSTIAGNNYLPSFVSRGFPFCVGAIAVPGAFPPTCSVSNAYFLGSDRKYTLDTRSLAGFGQLTFALTNRLKLIAGGRVTNDKIDIDLLQGRNHYFVSLGGPSVHVAQSYSDTNFSWKLGGQYQFTPVIMAYGFYGRGYKGPGFNDQAVNAINSLVVRQETSDGGEVGIKSSFFNRRLTIDVSAFVTTFDNFQVQSFDTNARAFIVQNAAKVRSKGVDLTVNLVPFRGLSLNTAASFLSSKFASFPGAQCYATQTANGCSPTVSTFDAGGNRLPGAPRFTSTIIAHYDIPVGGGIVPFVQGDWYHRSQIWFSVNQSPGTQFHAYDQFGASVGAKIGDGLRVSVFCKNCTNVHVPIGIGTDAGDGTASPPRLTYNQSFTFDSVRSLGFTLSSRF
ncbi:TonB-dependent receptor [Sphingomonas sp. RB3P16]|uniref:TonB-dependent receptor n=1 Tax=Parasphingomonas frigoris TaxID=3096163 RepID=UPI002FCB6F3B